jgi:excisionase family DNA binding protein
MTTNEVAEILRVSEHIVREGMKQGAIPYIRVGGQWRMTKKQLEGWLEDPKEFRSR